MARSTGIQKLKSSLRETLDQVKTGESVVITERGEPIARIVPIEPEAERMERLIRAGVLRAPVRPLDESFWKLPRMEDPEGLLVKAALEERGGGF
jgi:prevent-host-death family protein